jgi:phosphoacetylglucosamine mutase
MLMVEIALYHFRWSLPHWDGLYEDLPSRMSKVQVKDRNVVTTTDAERKCLQPAELQPAIDALIASKNDPCRRAFVRPSGTEDIVRIYAEAKTQAEADELAQQVCDATVKYCQ